MLNQLIVVGRIESYKDVDNGLELILRVPRISKDEEVDYIPFFVHNNMAVNVKQYCNKGDVIGIKGLVRNEEGIKLIAEKMTFLSTTKKPDDVLNTKDGE